MKKLVIFIGCLVAIAYGNAQGYREFSVDSVIRLMTVEEKVGQMSQIDLGVVAVGEICKLQHPQQLDLAKLDLAITKYHIGSILNVGCGSGTISRENWLRIHEIIRKENTAKSRLKIPILYGIDAIHGVNYTVGATLFPQPIGQAATWNPALVKRVNEITAYETRASGIPWNFSPVLDIGRQPLWSRFFETYGEDVCLARSMSKAAISGLQGDNVANPEKVAACMKHFLGYSLPMSGKDRTPAWISDRELREYFLPTFKEAIDAGAKTVMINSGEINGTPVHANYDILTTLLRKELGFKGVAVTDWEDIYKLVKIHRVAATKKEAVKMAIMSGIDMSMTPNDFEFNDFLIELVKEGSVPESRINESVKRILILKKELGLFDIKDPAATYPRFGSKEFADESYLAACESVTLLKNDHNILPLAKTGQKILVCGPAAHSLNLLNGAWTHTWQGTDTAFNTKGKSTILEALQLNYGKNTIVYSKGSESDKAADLRDCLAKAATADKIILCLGETPCTEIPGNIDDLSLNSYQAELADAIFSLQKPVILVCCFNRPRIIHPYVSKAEAIVYAYLPGDEGGRAVADCILGKENPSGKLPFTYPKAVNDLVHYDRKNAENQATDFSSNAYQPEFDFGFGLSYTSFACSDISYSKTTLSGNDSIEIRVTITNTGKQAGKEVVQLYYNDLVASITPSVKKLTGFTKVGLQPGETKIVRFVVTKDNFSFVNRELKRVTEPGEIELQVYNHRKIIYVN